MNMIPYILITFLSLLTAAYAQDTPGVSLYAVPLLGLFVTSMIVVIVWLIYKDKLEGVGKNDE